MRTWPVTLLLTILLPGCGSLLQEAKPTVWLSLEPALPAGGGTAGAPTLEVEAFATDAAFRGDLLSMREGSSRWSFTTYHRWVSEPGQMVASAARDYLGRSGLFGAVFAPPGPVGADYRLGGAVRNLFWDRERHAAVLEVEVSIVALPDTLRGYWVYRKEAPVDGDAVQGYLRAASSALGVALADLSRDIGAAIAGAERPRRR